MSSVTSNDVTIEDEEGVVDRKTKEHILNLRVQVDEDERALYVERASDPNTNLSVAEANQYWGISVRQYLRGIKRLWSSGSEIDGVRNVAEYWEERKIAEERLVPPDKAGYRFSLLETDQYGEQELKQRLGLPRKCELPKPVIKEFYGLNDVLSRNRIEHRWVVKTKMEGPPPQHESIVLQRVLPLPKHVLENAVEMADNFLQQAGLGFEIGVPDYRSTEPGL